MKKLLCLFVVLLLAGCNCGRANLDPYGKNFPPGETPTGDNFGDVTPPNGSFSVSDSEQQRTPMKLNPGD